jgi:hypothetical protein
MSVDSTRRSPSVIVKNNGVTIVSNDPAIGVHVDDSGVSIQGSVRFSSSGRNITKGSFCENDKSTKPYTYTETIQAEAAGKEAVYNALGKLGVDVSMLTNQGMAPLTTNVAYGPLPHIHTMMFKHVHKVEPAYLYRLSPLVSGLKNTLQQFQTFLAT